MTDISLQVILLKKYVSQFYELTNKKQYDQAYELAMTMTELAQQIEDVSKEMANNE